MEFGIANEQLMLQQSLGQFLDRHAPLEHVQRLVNERQTRDKQLWAGLAELGIAGLLVGEEHGGIGLNLLDAALVAETLGSRAAPAPFVATSALAPLALTAAGSPRQQEDWLPKIADGSRVVGAALSEVVSTREGAGVYSQGSTLSGTALFVLDFAADAYLVADQDRGLFWVEGNAPGLKPRELTTIDGTRVLGELTFDNTPAQRLPGSDDAEVCARLIDAGRILLAADTLGAAQAMLDRAVAYSKVRVQFGRPIGSFQAVKHMCAEMAAELEPCRAMMWYAAYAYDAIPSESRLTACHAKAHISEVGTQVARTATEVHGGVGFTAELGLHLWFKRIGVNRQLLGGPDRLREEAARLQQLV